MFVLFPLPCVVLLCLRKCPEQCLPPSLVRRGPPFSRLSAVSSNDVPLALLLGWLRQGRKSVWDMACKQLWVAPTTEHSKSGQ